MLLKICFLTATLAFTGPSFAQTASASCRADVAELEQSVDEAHAKGQMLRRRKLEAALTALQAECKGPMSPPSPATRAAAIESLEADIRQMRTDLDRAESALRRLKAEGA